ncbi:hypothetical protein FS749_000877 [Ceratobasidium sp. UAMH 11750]|nr:hypothetical protein FS749_000877 [Ceratobasidium sp. UAMH 11750]
MNNNPIIPGVLLGGALAAALYSWYRSRPSVPLPPGPKGRFMVGNALDIRNAKAPWLKFAEYNDQYGPIVTVRVLNNRWIIISDPHLISELFEKRAANYSDKNVNQIIKLIGWDRSIVFLPYGPLLKRYRTMLHRALNNRVALDYIPLQQYEVRRFMRRLVENPSRFMEHIHLMAASIAVRIAYGHKVESAEDRFVQSAEEIMSIFSNLLKPANVWVLDMFPFLRYLPAWFPLAGFQRQAQYVRQLRAVHQTKPFECVLEQMANGTAEDSFTSKLLQPEDGQSVDDETKDQIKGIASSLYSAGSDTTVAGVQFFFLAMTLYPEVQAKAQAEIAAYMQQFGNDRSVRMISPEDRANLPYTSALVREVLRWHPIANLVGHRSSDEDDCNVTSGGNTYTIPARSLVLANIWQIMHDPEVYKEPERFMPERYLAENPPPGPESYAFGFGRRICPGIHIAQQSMWISISNTLANFTITKAKDESGAEITPKEQYSNGLVSHPLPFPCNITPRGGRKEWLQDIE